MKTIFVPQPFADQLANGHKKELVQNWITPYTGDLLIVSTRESHLHAVCIVKLEDGLNYIWRFELLLKFEHPFPLAFFDVAIRL